MNVKRLHGLQWMIFCSFVITSFDIFNPLGEKIKSLLENNLETGRYKVLFNAGDLPSGIYYYLLNNGKNSITKKMLLIK
jgi:hypothetical protein